MKGKITSVVSASDRMAYFSDLQDKPKALLSLLLQHLKKHHGLSEQELNSFLDDEKHDAGEISIPLSIFNKSLSSLETVVKYLKETHNMGFQKIAEALNRNISTIWTTYKNSERKYKGKLISGHAADKEFYIPVSRFQDRVFSSLEVIVLWLKDNYKLSYHDMAVLLRRDDSTVWTVYHRALKKKEKNNSEERQE